VFRLALKRMLNQKARVIVTMVAMIAIFTLIPLGIHFSQESKLAVAETIEEHGRGVYDILVRPANSRSPIEQKLGVVEENYIGDSQGGISVEEWRAIQEMEGVDLAAPVASLGYFSGNQTNIRLPLLDHPARFIWQFSTSDGIQKHLIDEPITFTYFEHFSDRKKGQWVEYLSPGGVGIGYMGFMMPTNYYLVAAIDHESESELTGIDYSLLEKDPMDPLDNGSYRLLENFLNSRDYPEVFPIIQREDLRIPLHLSLTVEELDIDLEEYKEKCKVEKDRSIYTCDPEVHDDVLAELDERPALSSEQYEFDLSFFQSPFDGTSLEIGEDFEIRHSIGGSLGNDTGVYYLADKINYELSDGKIHVDIIEDGSPPSYKRVEQRGESFWDVDDPSFMMWQMGEFSVLEEEILAASPLGIYGSEDVYTEDRRKLTSTIIPGSFIAAPAAGVTTLEAAEHIKGEQPIDAIRIRVTGGPEYDLSAQEKINKLSLELLEQGYEVDVVAGASYKEIEMDVEGIGKVFAKFTTLGIAQSLTEGFNALALFTTICFALFGIAWFGARLIYERNAKAEEDEILAQIGWRSSLIKRRNIYEQFILLTTAFFLSLALLFLTNMALSWTLYLVLVYLLLLIFMVGLFLTSSQRREARRERKGLLHYLPLIIPVAIVLIFSVGLTIVLFTSLIQSLLEARESTLGAFVVDETLYLQIFVLVTTVVLMLISITEAINAIIRERRDEFIMYHTIGWSSRMIRFHFGKEVYLWSGFSLVLGGLMSLIILRQLDVSPQWSLLSLGLVCILFFLGITAIVWTRKFGEIKEVAYASGKKH